MEILQTKILQTSSFSA